MPEICEKEKCLEEFVNWKNFVWVVSIFTAMIIGLGGMVVSLSSRVSTNDIEMAKIQTKLTNIEAQLVELKVLIKDTK